MDIKMSEVFPNLPTSPTEFWLSPYSPGSEIIRKKEMQAIVHAINNHDKLVAENEKLREMLAEAVADTEPESKRHWHDEAKELLNRT